MKKFTNYFTALFIGGALSLGIVTAVALPNVVHAQANEKSLCEGSGGTYSNGSCKTPDGKSVMTVIRQIVNVLSFVVGSIAGLMIVIGGLRYVLSSGDQSSVTSAKNTILYSVVGLVVTASAAAIVNLVMNSLNI